MPHLRLVHPPVALRCGPPVALRCGPPVALRCGPPVALRCGPLAALRCVGLAALLLVLASGCGDPAPTPPYPEEGAPTWSAARDESRGDGVMIDVHADAPCRAHLRILGAAESLSEPTPRLLAAGETARLWVSARAESQPSPGSPVAGQDATAGRGEAWVATLSYEWEDGANAKRVHVIGVRPGRGRALGSWTVAPSPVAVTLPYGRELELAATAIADGGGELVLEGRENGSRVRGPLDTAAGDRVTLLRFVVRMERMGP